MQGFHCLKDLKNVFDSASNGILIIDKFGFILVYSKAAGKLLGKAPEDMVGKNLKDIFPSAWTDLKEVIRAGKPQIGKKVEIEGSVIIANRNPIYKGNSIIGVISIFQDVSEYEKIATELESYKRLNKDLDAIIDSSFDGLWVCDSKSKVVRINSASEKINNISADEVLGRNIQDLMREGRFDRCVTPEVLKIRAAVTLIQHRKDGRQLLLTGNPVFDDKGNIRLVVVNERDMTALNQMRNELQKSQALARHYREEIDQLQFSRKSFSEAVFKSKSIRRVLSKAIKVAKVDSTVCIQGESGTGKGLFADLIHKASNRKNGPLIRVDCGAIPETLIESELFGYEGGAFTGARATGKLGHFEIADGGVLFLDEIGELPLNIQVKLLRFMEKKELIHIGGNTPNKIDVRIIVATNRDLEEMVKEGTFRKDLFFRLNVVPLKIPPLRERREVIPSLIQYFLNKFNERFEVRKVITARAIDCLCSYSFPGNIRELANLLEQLVVLTPGERIEMEDLPDHIINERNDIDFLSPENDWDLRKATQKLETEMIIRSLKLHGTQRKAADRLGIDQSTLARKVKKYRIRFDAIVHSID